MHLGWDVVPYLHNKQVQMIGFILSLNGCVTLMMHHHIIYHLNMQQNTGVLEYCLMVHFVISTVLFWYSSIRKYTTKNEAKFWVYHANYAWFILFHKTMFFLWLPWIWFVDIWSLFYKVNEPARNMLHITLCRDSEAGTNLFFFLSFFFPFLSFQKLGTWGSVLYYDMPFNGKEMTIKKRSTVFQKVISPILSMFSFLLAAYPTWWH